MIGVGGWCLAGQKVRAFQNTEIPTELHSEVAFQSSHHTCSFVIAQGVCVGGGGSIIQTEGFSLMNSHQIGMGLEKREKVTVSLTLANGCD